MCKRLGITSNFLEQWIKKYQTNPKVLEVLRNIEDLHDQAIEKHKINEMHYQLSDALTREVYVQVSRKVLACVRHECYNQVQEILKREGRSQITNEELDEILDKIGEKYQEGYRVGAMKLYGVEVPEGEVPKRYLQKAYLKFSTISTVESEPGKPATRPKWNSLVQHE